MYQTTLALIAVLTLNGIAFAGTPAENLAKKPLDWFRSDEGRARIDNMLSWQTEHGDWPKNMDTTQTKYDPKKEKPAGTFDNGATTGELRALAQAFQATEDTQYRDAFVKGLDHILRSQYPNGGWPQYSPPSKGYQRFITFNDDSMIRLMRLLDDVSRRYAFRFVDETRRVAAANAVEKGINCILKCQVVVDGTLTVWCAQHDEKTFAAVPARKFEPKSLSGNESTAILLFLMSLEEPSPEVIRAVKAGAAWFEKSKIKGYRYFKRDSGAALVAGANAEPLWARFYEIETNRPIFGDRDGSIHYDIQEISGERRGGYVWYGNWGEKVARKFREWPHA